MPQFSSDPTWDQGLSTLAQGLFPNPAGIAQGAYYGAEARRAGMQASEIQRKMQAQDALPAQLADLFGGGAGAGTNAPATPPVASALTPPPPPPPSGTPMPTSGAVAFPNIPLPGMTAPMPPAPGALSNGPQASVATPTPVNDSAPPVPQLPPGQSYSVGLPYASGPPPQPGAAPAAMPPGQPGGLSSGQMNLSGLLSSYLSPGSPFMGGPAPLQSPPSSISPPAPNTTGSDGSVPHPDPSAALMHPGTLQDPGGGVKYAPPASANGAPAPTLVNLGSLIALAARTGMDPGLVKSMVGTAVESMVRQGVLDKPTADRILTAGGEVGSYLSTQSGQLTAEQAANYRAGLPVAEQARQFNLTPQNQIDPVTHLPVTTTRANVIAAAGTNAPFSPYDDTLIRQQALPATVQGPNGQPVIVPQGQSYGRTPVNAAMQTPVTVLNTDGTTRTVTTGEAIQQGLQVAPKDMETFTAARAAAIANAYQSGNTSLGDQLARSAQAGLSQTAPVKTGTPAADIETWNHILDSEVQKAFPVPQAPTGSGLNTDPSVLNTNARNAVMARAQQLGLTGNQAQRASPTRAVDDAITQMQSEGLLPANADRATHWWQHVDPFHALPHRVTIGGKSFYGIDLQTPPPAGTPGTNAPPQNTAPTNNPPVLTTRPGTNTPINTVPQQTPPIAAQARSGSVISTSAPPGAREGQKVYGSNGQVGIVRGGAIVAP
jgi:hypothetical protein